MLTNAPWFAPNAIIRNNVRVTTIRQEVKKKNTATPTGRGSLCIPTTWQPPYSKGYPATEDSNVIILNTWSLDLITSRYNPLVSKIDPWRLNLKRRSFTGGVSRVLNVLGQLALDWGIKWKKKLIEFGYTLPGIVCRSVRFIWTTYWGYRKMLEAEVGF